MKKLKKFENFSETRLKMFGDNLKPIAVSLKNIIDEWNKKSEHDFTDEEIIELLDRISVYYKRGYVYIDELKDEKGDIHWYKSKSYPREEE